jgi:hypothetical protein
MEADVRNALFYLAPRRGKQRATQTRSSCPDLIRASINLCNKAFSKRMDHRVEPGDDDLKQFRSQSLIRGDLLKRPALFYRAPV